MGPRGEFFGGHRRLFPVPVKANRDFKNKYRSDSKYFPADESGGMLSLDSHSNILLLFSGEINEKWIQARSSSTSAFALWPSV